MQISALQATTSPAMFKKSPQFGSELAFTLNPREGITTLQSKPFREFLGGVSRETKTHISMTESERHQRYLQTNAYPGKSVSTQYTQWRVPPLMYFNSTFKITTNALKGAQEGAEQKAMDAIYRALRAPDPQLFQVLSASASLPKTLDTTQPYQGQDRFHLTYNPVNTIA